MELRLIFVAHQTHWPTGLSQMRTVALLAALCAGAADARRHVNEFEIDLDLPPGHR